MGRRSGTGTVLLEAETRFHRIQGYRQLPLLINALRKTLDKQEAAAWNRLLPPDRRSNCHGKRDNFKKWHSCTVCCLWAEGEGVR